MEPGSGGELDELALFSAPSKSPPVGETLNLGGIDVFFLTISVAAITHPADASLGDPLFRFAGKRVGDG